MFRSLRGKVRWNDVSTPEALRESMAEFGIDYVLITPTLNLYLPIFSDERFAHALSKAYNDFVVAEFLDEGDEGFKAAITLSPLTPHKAAEEIGRPAVKFVDRRDLEGETMVLAERVGLREQLPLGVEYPEVPLAVTPDRVEDRRFRRDEHLDEERNTVGPRYPEEPLILGVPDEVDSLDGRILFECLLDMLAGGSPDPEQRHQRLAPTGNSALDFDHQLGQRLKCVREREVAGWNRPGHSGWHLWSLAIAPGLDTGSGRHGQAEHYIDIE